MSFAHLDDGLVLDGKSIGGLLRLTQTGYGNLVMRANGGQLWGLIRVVSGRA